MAVATSSAAKLATNDFVRDKLTAITHGHLTIAGIWNFTCHIICHKGLIGALPGEMVAGGVAGVANAILSSPLELLKLRLQVVQII